MNIEGLPERFSELAIQYGALMTELQEIVSNPLDYQITHPTLANLSIIFVRLNTALERIHEEVRNAVESSESYMIDERNHLIENLKRSIDEVEMTVRTYNCIKNEGTIMTIGDLAQRTELDLLKTRNFGWKCVNELNDILASMGLTLGMKFNAEILAELALLKE